MARFFRRCSPRTPAQFDVVTGAARPADGLPDRPLANRPRRLAPCFPLFYLVEITHRQLHSMISHPLRALDAMRVRCDYGNCMFSQYRKFRTAP